jgi:SSS family transporter
METLDSILFYGLVLTFIGIGAFVAIRDKIRKKTPRDHDVNGADFKTSRASLSLFASTLSASLLIRNPASTYFHGPQNWIGVLSLPSAIVFANLVTVPIFVRRNDKTALSYLESRFGKAVLVVSLIFQIMETLMMMSFWISVPMRTLSRVTKVSNVWNTAIVVVVVTIYSALGGMRAIQRIDLIQLLIIAAANIAVVSKGTATIGGFDHVFSVNQNAGRSYFVTDMNPFTEKETSLVILTSNFMFMVIRYSINQSVINRYSPASDVSSARLVLWAQIPLMGFANITSTALGLVIYGYYYGCDPLLTLRIRDKDDVVGLYFGDLLGHRPGIVGLFSGSILSSTLSATSSNLNGLASIMHEHILKYDVVERIRKKLRIGKIAIRFCIPVIALCLSLALIEADKSLNGELTNSSTALNVFVAPVMGLFLMGFFNKRATKTGALIGLSAGFLIGITIFVMKHVYHVSKEPSGASVTDCWTYYCTVTNATACADVPVNPNSTVTIVTGTTTSIPMTSKAVTSKTPIQLAYGLGGMVTMLVTFVIGSLFSFFEKQTPDERKNNTDLLAFVKDKDE